MKIAIKLRFFQLADQIAIFIRKSRLPFFLPIFTEKSHFFQKIALSSKKIAIFTEKSHGVGAAQFYKLFLGFSVAYLHSGAREGKRNSWRRWFLLFSQI